MQRTLYSGHLSVEGIIFSPNSNYPLELTSLQQTRPRNFTWSILEYFVSYKTFLVRNSYTFYFRQCYTVSFNFSSIFVIFFSQLNGISRSVKMKIRGDSQSVFISMADVFPSCKDVQSTIGQKQKHGYNHVDFCCTWSTVSSLQ